MGLKTKMWSNVAQQKARIPGGSMNENVCKIHNAVKPLKSFQLSNKLQNTAYDV